jgi:hypothetical protein
MSEKFYIGHIVYARSEWAVAVYTRYDVGTRVRLHTGAGLALDAYPLSWGRRVTLAEYLGVLRGTKENSKPPIRKTRYLYRFTDGWGKP